MLWFILPTYILRFTFKKISTRVIYNITKQICQGYELGLNIYIAHCYVCYIKMVKTMQYRLNYCLQLKMTMTTCIFANEVLKHLPVSMLVIGLLLHLRMSPWRIMIRPVTESEAPTTDD